MTLTAEQQAVLRSIRQLVDFWQISAHELGLTDFTPRRAKPQPPVHHAPKYRHPVTGQLWNGVGLQPDWIKEALIREGYTVDELRITQTEHGMADPA